MQRLIESARQSSIDFNPIGTMQHWLLRLCGLLNHLYQYSRLHSALPILSLLTNIYQARVWGHFISRTTKGATSINGIIKFFLGVWISLLKRMLNVSRNQGNWMTSMPEYLHKELRKNKQSVRKACLRNLGEANNGSVLVNDIKAGLG